ncbi:hypothetical protein OK016_21380 [Vibrio chagasii]|nr:hypothetical protein [Vibrio chagasii]
MLISFEGDTLLNLVKDGEQAQLVLTTGDVFSVPAGASYSLENLRGTSFTYVVLGSDQPRHCRIINDETRSTTVMVT